MVITASYEELNVLIFGRMWAVPEAKDMSRLRGVSDEKLQLVSDDCDPKVVSTKFQDLVFLFGD